MTITQFAVVRRSALLPIVIAAVLVGACQKAPEVVPPPPPEVTVTTPIQKDVTVFQEFVGSTEAYKSVNIRARVQGFLDSMHFEPSAFVRTGQLLFVIEPEPYEAQRDRAAAGLKAAGKGLRDRLDELAAEFGLYATSQVTISFVGMTEREQLLVVVGVGLGIGAVAAWAFTDFGLLEPDEMLRLVVPSVLLIAVGTQFVATSFVLSSLDLYRRPERRRVE